MVKHIILWKLKEELTSPQKKQIKAEAKQALEGLNGVVPGLISLTLHTGGLPGIYTKHHRKAFEQELVGGVHILD